MSDENRIYRLTTGKQMKNACTTFIMFAGAFTSAVGVTMLPLWGWGGIVASIGIAALAIAGVMQREIAKSEWKYKAEGISEATGNQVKADDIVIVAAIVAILGGGALFLWSSEARMLMNPYRGMIYSMGGITAFMAGLLVLLESRTAKRMRASSPLKKSA